MASPSASRFKTQSIGLRGQVYQPILMGFRFNSRWLPVPGTGATIGGLLQKTDAHPLVFVILTRR